MQKNFPGDRLIIFSSFFFFFSAFFNPAVFSQTQEEALRLYHQIAEKSPERLSNLSRQEQSFLWDLVYRNKIAGLDDPVKLSRYDPDGLIGYCFGRKEAVRYAARRMGLNPNAMAALFVIGDLRSGIVAQWRFHVTSLKRGPGQAFYAIDPIMPGPLPISEWIKSVQSVWDRKRQAFYYLTPASMVIPDLEYVPDAPKEDGSRIIEIRFDPSQRPNEFARRKDLGERVYEPKNLAVAQKYFRAPGASKNPFNFLKVTINGQKISFRGYFLDLLKDIANAPDDIFKIPAGRALKPLGLAAPHHLARRVVLGSLRSPLLGSLIRR